MTQGASNHPGQTHAAAKGRGKKTKKQFVRIEGKARIYWIHADDDAWDTKLHLTGKPLVCPDSGCHQKMRASQLKNPPYTKYLSDVGGPNCSHFVPRGGGGRTTEEHLWLQGSIRQICEELGYPSHLESDYADIKVEAERDWAIEVQRVSTDHAQREEQRRSRGMETLWLLPESAQRTKDAGSIKGSDPVFSTRAVRLLYRCADGRGPRPDEKYLREKVWANRTSKKVELYVAATLWTVPAGGEYVERVTAPMPLRDFLREVLRGERSWHPRSELVPYTVDRSGWAGWIREEELEAARTALTGRETRLAEEELRRLEERERNKNEDVDRNRREEAARLRAEQENSEQTGSGKDQVGVPMIHPAAVPAPSPQRPDYMFETSAGSGGVAGTANDSDALSGALAAASGTSGSGDEPWWRRIWRALAGR